MSENGLHEYDEDLVIEKFNGPTKQPKVGRCYGFHWVPGRFIKYFFDLCYKEKELKKIDDETYYQMFMLEHDNECELYEGIYAFYIPIVNEKKYIPYFKFNTSSPFALEMCGYDLEEINVLVDGEGIEMLPFDE